MFLAYNKNNFDPYNVFLTIATNKPMLVMTGFVVTDISLIHLLPKIPFNTMKHLLFFFSF